MVARHRKREMLPRFFDSAGAVTRKVTNRHPNEKTLLTTASTILEQSERSLFRRFLDQRGTTVITDQRLFVESGFRSPVTALWALMAFGCFCLLVSTGNLGWGCVGMAAIVFGLQRRVYTQDLPFEQVDDVQFSAVNGTPGNADIMTVTHQGRVIQLVTAQQLSPAFQQWITGQIDNPN